MPYTELRTAGGLFLVDGQLITRVLRDSEYFINQNANAKEVDTKEGMGLPRTYHIEVDFRRARLAAERYKNRFWRNWQARHRQLERDCQLPTVLEIEQFREFLRDREKRASRARDQLVQKQKATTRKSIDSIDSKVHQWETAKKVAEVTRNMSAEVLLVCAGALTGGAALKAKAAVGGAGAFLKGVGKYQDTDSVGAAVLEAGFSFGTLFIPGPKEMRAGGAARILVFAKPTTKFVGKVAVGYVEHGDFRRATTSAAVDTAISAMFDKAFEGILPENIHTDLLNESLSDIPIPVNAKLTLEAIGDVGGGQLSKQMTDRLMRSARSTGGAARQTPRGTFSGGTVLLAEPALADIAVLGPDASTRTW